MLMCFEEINIKVLLDPIEKVSIQGNKTLVQKMRMCNVVYDKLIFYSLLGVLKLIRREMTLYLLIRLGMYASLAFCLCNMHSFSPIMHLTILKKPNLKDAIVPFLRTRQTMLLFPSL